LFLDFDGVLNHDRLMDPGLAVRAINRTPLVTGEGSFEPGIPHGREVGAWRQICRHDGPFIILVDRVDLEPHLHRLVQTGFEFCLTGSDVRQAIELLRSSVGGPNNR
jgi:hypothetical protein